MGDILDDATLEEIVPAELLTAPEDVDQDKPRDSELPATRSYQQEMFEESLKKNLIIALETGAGKTHVALLRLKHQMEREKGKTSWFLAPTVALCEQQHKVIERSLSTKPGLISGACEPAQWTDIKIWTRVLREHRIVVSTPQVLLDALTHGYVHLGLIDLLIFDEVHHAQRDHPYNMIMKTFYFSLPRRDQFANSPTTGPIICRPMILGLTASPVFGGGNAEHSFQVLETNMDCIIYAPRTEAGRAELSRFVHKPILKHALYVGPDYSNYESGISGSSNLDSLKVVIDSLEIKDDPYIKKLRRQLENARPGSDYFRTDQKLSKAINKKDTYTFKGLADFYRASEAICYDVGTWAANLYVHEVTQLANKSFSPYEPVIMNWDTEERARMTDILGRVDPIEPSPDEMMAGLSDKVRALAECLRAEHQEVTARGEVFKGIVFVTRRDTTVALTRVLKAHPLVKDYFTVDCILGNSRSAYRRSFMDITQGMLKRSTSDTLEEFGHGDVNLLIATSVAEEGIDIRACCCVVRWDLPQNMISWTQSRGRARQQQSSFIMLFDSSGIDAPQLQKWQDLERDMTALYNDPSRTENAPPGGYPLSNGSEEDEADYKLEFRIESTGAVLTPVSAVTHLNHFCATLPNAAKNNLYAIYDIDPPDYPEGWHSFDEAQKILHPYTGPFGSTVTLPRVLPSHLRVFSVGREYTTKQSAHRHAAFKAYLALHSEGLVNDNLLPLTSVRDGDDKEEVEELLKEVGKRSGKAGVRIQMDPWLPPHDDSHHNGADAPEMWWKTELKIAEGIPPLHLLTRVPIPEMNATERPLVYRTGEKPYRVLVTPLGPQMALSPEALVEARRFTRRVLWSFHGKHMKWDQADYAYLFLRPEGHDNNIWDGRRDWLHQTLSHLMHPERQSSANADDFARQFSYPNDLTLVRDRDILQNKLSRFLRWHHEPLTESELACVPEHHRLEPHEPPYLVVKAYPERANFLVPAPIRAAKNPVPAPTGLKTVFLNPKLSFVELTSQEDAEIGLVMPSVLRYLQMALTAFSIKEKLFTEPLKGVPIDLILTAITAPSAREQVDYQRMETLGDCVLKFMVSVQVLADFPLWHEGYLSRKKDHTVSNYKLAKEAISRNLYNWIIRDVFIPRKWKPELLHSHNENSEDDESDETPKEDLSTKVLADVVEAIIGACYLHGGYDLSIECGRMFNLGIKWEKISKRVEEVLSRVEIPSEPPEGLSYVEDMLGYEFERKLLLVEALTHASHQHSPYQTTSYERLEFLGDAVLDIIVTEYLYRAPGKSYSPGHMHLRKSAVVNTHYLAFLCLSTSILFTTSMPIASGQGRSRQITFIEENQCIYLWQCLQHSSGRVIEDQTATFVAFKKHHDEIAQALTSGDIFPWSLLTRLQAPKFFSDMIESLIGAVYLDSRGDFETVRRVITKLGILPMLERIVREDVDVLHPISRVSMWASKKGKKIEYEFEKKDGSVECILKFKEGEEIFRASTAWRGKISQDEARFAAAEGAIRMMRLREESEA